MNSNIIYGKATLVAALLTIVILTAALVMQYAFGLMPCPLCLVQRGIFVLIFIFSLIEFLSRRKNVLRTFFCCITGLVSVLGMLVAGRHIWLQNTPASEIPSCLPSLDYLVDTFSLAQIVAKVFAGSSECSEVSWTFLGLSIPEQTFILFLLYFLFSIMKLLPVQFMKKDSHI